jgi:uncharacterized protein YqhQ
MISVCGSSYNNGISFIGTNFSVNFESYPNSTKIIIRKNKGKETSKVLNALTKIPFLRGISAVIRDSKFLAPFLLIDFVQNIISVNMSSMTEKSSFLSNFIINGITLILLALSLVYVIKKVFINLKSTWQYHGAEHKVIYTNYKKTAITLGNCRNAPRISDNCGTMLVSLLIVVFIILDVVTKLFRISMWSSFYFFISYVLANELFMLKRDVPAISWIFKFGYWFQKHVCTLEPSDFQLSQAIEAFTLLERAETNQIPDGELEELLQNGKEVFLNKVIA